MMRGKRGEERKSLPKKKRGGKGSVGRQIQSEVKKLTSIGWGPRSHRMTPRGAPIKLRKGSFARRHRKARRRLKEIKEETRRGQGAVRSKPEKKPNIMTRKKAKKKKTPTC